MDKGKIIKRSAGQYIVRIKIGGKLYEHEAATRKAAEALLEKLIKENRDL